MKEDNLKNEEEQSLIKREEIKKDTEIQKLQFEVENDENELDRIIEKIPFNFCHIKILILMAIYCSGEGFVMLSTSLILPVLDKAWKLTEFQKGFIGGSIFLGFMLGALCVGIVSDRKGRKVAFTLGCLFSLFGSLIGVFSTNWIFLSITNIIVGVGIGISIPSCMSLISEVTNHALRSMIMSWVWIFFPVGEIAGCYIAKYYQVYDYTQDHWRKLLVFRIISVINNIILVFSCYSFYLHGS